MSVATLNLLAGIAYPIVLLLVAVILVRSFILDNDSQSCLGLGEADRLAKPKATIDEESLAMAAWLGLIVLTVSIVCTSLFAWCFGEPMIGTFVAVLVLAIIFFPDQIADFTGEVVCFVSNLFESVALLQVISKCPKCWNTSVRPEAIQKKPVAKIFIPAAQLARTSSGGEIMPVFYLELNAMPPNYEMLSCVCGKCGEVVGVPFSLGTASRLGLDFSYAAEPAEPKIGPKPVKLAKKTRNNLLVFATGLILTVLCSLFGYITYSDWGAAAGFVLGMIFGRAIWKANLAGLRRYGVI